MDDYEFLAPIAVIVLAGGLFAYRYFRYGSLIGVSLGSRVARTLGEVKAERTLGMRRSLKVHLLERELGQPTYVAIGETVSGWASWKQRSMKLSIEEARKLARLLDEAAAAAKHL
jgi:hypothetical protein